MKLSTITHLITLGYQGLQADLETFRLATGVAPDQVETALAEAVAAARAHQDTFQVGRKHDRIRTAEAQLQRLGFDVGAKDGVLDQTLADAIVAFKRQHPELGNLGRFLGQPVSQAIAADAAKLHASRTPMVLGEISARAFSTLYPRLEADLRSGKLQKGTPIVVGSYGVNPQMAADLQKLKALNPAVKYRPMFGLVMRHPQSRPWSGRDPSVGGDPRYAGQVPPYKTMRADEKYAWGQEIGRRFRDALETAKAKGISVDGWMLDEIWPSAGKNADTLKLMQGVLDGLHLGRDGTVSKGTVYVGSLAKLVNAEPSPTLESFWRSMDQASDQVVQEEYPIFGKGLKGAAANAENANRLDAKLATLGPAALAISHKLIAGMSPGYRPAATHGLYREHGKNADGTTRFESLGLTPRQVQQWREGYMKARQQAGVVGYGQFGLLEQNAEPEVVNQAIDALEAELEG